VKLIAAWTAVAAAPFIALNVGRAIIRRHDMEGQFDMIKCYRSTYSEWLIDLDNGRYRRRPRTDVPPDPRQQVPYDEAATEWRPMTACSVTPINGAATSRLRVTDPRQPHPMLTIVCEVLP